MFALPIVSVTQLVLISALRKQELASVSSLIMANYVLHASKVTLRILKLVNATRLESAKTKVVMSTVLAMVSVNKLVRQPNVFVMLDSLTMVINNAADVLMDYSNSLTASLETSTSLSRMSSVKDCLMAFHLDFTNSTKLISKVIQFKLMMEF